MKISKAIKKLPHSKEEVVKGITERQLNNVKNRDNPFSEHDPSLHFRQRVVDKGFKIKKLIAVYYSGWECDRWAVMATKDGKRYKITTLHDGIVVIKSSKR